MNARTRSRDDYTVGWICALPVETAAAKLMLDKIHPPLPRLPMDQNNYIFGSIGEHNVVVASLPTGSYGTTSAATIGMQLLSSFQSIRFGFMVGIGGGVPSSHADIRLGDIVVSQPTDTSGGVIQYDLGKALSGGQFKRTGMLNRPPKVLLTALATLQAHHLTEDSQAVGFISNLQAKLSPHKATKFTRPTQEDCLFQAEYDHVISDTCIDCDRSRLVSRTPREHQEPVIHYGLIGSANQVIKDGRRRDQLASDLGINCVEMEVAGLMKDFPCLVIRGICDYADSHKNKEWQGYAAAVAAAYAKELLLAVPVDQINSTPTARDILAYHVHRFDVPLDLTAVPVIENFLGRQSELDQLWQYLRATGSQSRKVAVLHGLGGIGKTQLAIRFARDHKHDFTAIFWLSGKDRGTLLQSLSSIFPRLPGHSKNTEAVNNEETEQRARDVLRWLAIEGNSRWLIIFDNIDQYSPVKNAASNAYDIEEFLPAADHGSIIITTRLRQLTELGKSFPINKLDSDDAIKLLLQSSHLSKNTITESESNPDTLALASRLDGLPLAIVTAGAFMRETGISITMFLQYYQESWSDLQLHSNPPRHYQQLNMLQTWMISYHEIQRRDPNAASLLLFLAHFDNRDIWYELVQSGSNSSDVPSWLAKILTSRLAFGNCVRTLIELSFLETKPQEASYSMHPVVQDWCLHVASTDKNVNLLQLNELALICVGYTVPRASNRDHSELQQRLIPQAKYVSHGIWSDSNIEVWRAFHDIGFLFSDQRQLQEAEEMFQRALAGYEKALGPDHTSTLDTVNNLANVLKDQGKLQEAEEMFQRVLASKDLGDSDVFSGNDSVFSAAISIPSTKSLESGRGEINLLLIQEFATLLHENAILLSLISVGVSEQRIGFERMRTNFRRLLKDFANNLKAEILNELHRELRSFVSSYSDMITRELFAMTPIIEEPNSKHRLASIKKSPSHERKVEDYLEKLHGCLTAPASEEFDKPSNATEPREAIEPFDLDEESDQDSVGEEAGEDESYEGSLQHLDQMKHFILESAAYEILVRRLEEFVQPSLYSRLRDMVTRWSCPDHKNHDDVARYKLWNLVTDLKHVDPYEIQFEYNQEKEEDPDLFVPQPPAPAPKAAPRQSDVADLESTSGQGEKREPLKFNLDSYLARLRRAERWSTLTENEQARRAAIALANYDHYKAQRIKMGDIEEEEEEM